MAHSVKKSDPQLEAALKRLDGLVERAPELGEPAAFYRAALPALHEAQAGVVPLALNPGMTQRKLAAGLPLLIDEDLPLDPDAIRALWLRLCQIVKSVGSPAAARPRAVSLFERGRSVAFTSIDQVNHGSGRAPRADAAAMIQQVVERNELNTFAVVSALAAGEWWHSELMAADLALDADLLRILAQNSLKPTLRVWMQGLKDSVDVSGWQRGQCPFCGSPPVFAEIRGSGGARYLRCAMCGGDWPFPRLRCAFCANEDYKQLGYIAVEGEEGKYRLQTCERCHNYLKVVVTFDPTPIDQLVVEDLITLHLDFIASEREFMRAPVP